MAPACHTTDVDIQDLVPGFAHNRFKHAPTFTAGPGATATQRRQTSSDVEPRTTDRPTHIPTATSDKMARRARGSRNGKKDRRSDNSLHRCLAVNQLNRAHLRALGQPGLAITLGDDAYLRPSRLGTASTPVGASYMRPFDMVVEAYKDGRVQTAYKNRPVHGVSMLQALMGLVAEFDPLAQEVVVTHLATRLVGFAEAKGFLKGYSNPVRAAACLLAADVAFRRGVVSETGLEMLGLYGKAVISAFRVLKKEAFMDPQVLLAVFAARGDSMAFPGGGGGTGRVQARSALTVAREAIAARGGSRLREVEHADPEPVAEVDGEMMGMGCPVQRSNRYYSNLLDDGLLFELDDDSEDEDDGGGVPLSGNH